MKKILKWILISLAGIILLLAAGAIYFKNKFETLANREAKVNPAPITIPDDSVSLERGKILSVGCRGCHGHDYSGLDFFNDPTIGYMSSPNITSAKGSATEKYSDLDWVRTLRHAVSPKGRILMVMPSEAIGLLSDQDLGCLIAYLKSARPIEKPQGPTHFTVMAKIMAGAGLFGNLYPYDIIDHEKMDHIAAPPKSSSPEYGKYMIGFHGCTTCHGKNLNGGISSDPVSPPGLNITAGGNLGKWSLDEFKSTMRGGKTPEGKILDPKFMPWPGVAAHDDIELEALYNYLKSIPSMETDPAVAKKLAKMKK